MRNLISLLRRKVINQEKRILVVEDTLQEGEAAVLLGGNERTIDFVTSVGQALLAVEFLMKDKMNYDLIVSSDFSQGTFNNSEEIQDILAFYKWIKEENPSAPFILHSYSSNLTPTYRKAFNLQRTKVFDTPIQPIKYVPFVDSSLHSLSYLGEEVLGTSPKRFSNIFA